MRHSTGLQVLYGLYQLVHDHTNFSFFQLVVLNVLKQLSSFGLVHDDKHVLVCFKRFSHLDDIRVRYQLDDLDFFS